MSIKSSPWVLNVDHPVVLHDGSIFWHDEACNSLRGDVVWLSDGRKFINGTRPRSESGIAVGAIRGSKPWSSFNFPVVPKGEWEAEIAAADKAKRQPYDHIDFPPLDQNGLGYCWIYCSTGAAMTRRRYQGNEYRLLSACSVGAPVNNFVNQGGWPAEGMQYAAENGWCEMNEWPDHSLSRSLMQDSGVVAQRPFYKISEMLECDGSGDTLRGQIISLLTNGIPIVVTYNWWSHAVYMVRARVVNGQLLFTIRNSWGSWGYANANNTDGFGDYDAYGKGLPNEAIGLPGMMSSTYGVAL